MFPNQMHGQMTAMTGMQPGKKKTHRGSRGGKNKHKLKNGLKMPPPANAHHAQAQAHLANAATAATPQAAHAHLFKGLTALKKAMTSTSSGPLPSAGTLPATQPAMPPAGAPSGGSSNGY